MNDLEVVKDKLENYKKFLREISKNKGIVEQYEKNLNFFQLLLFVNTYLRGKKDNLIDVSKEMQQKLDFSDEFLEKNTRYLQMFCDYLLVSDEKLEESVKILQNNEKIEEKTEEKSEN